MPNVYGMPIGVPSGLPDDSADVLRSTKGRQRRFAMKVDFETKKCFFPTKQKTKAGKPKMAVSILHYLTFFPSKGPSFKFTFSYRKGNLCCKDSRDQRSLSPNAALEEMVRLLGEPAAKVVWATVCTRAASLAI